MVFAKNNISSDVQDSHIFAYVSKADHKVN